jgi:hypothetical protein
MTRSVAAKAFGLRRPTQSKKTKEKSYFDF